MSGFSDDIKKSFDRLKADAEQQVKSIYGRILSDTLASAGTKDIASALAGQEAQLVNDYIVDLKQQVKEASIRLMVAGGCKEYLTQTAWTNIQRQAGVPKAELCSPKAFSAKAGRAAQERPAASRAANAGSAKIHTARLERLEQLSRRSKRAKCASVLGAGAAASAAIYGLVVPGWNATEIAICTAGAAVFVVAGSAALLTDRQIREEKNKISRARADAAAQQKTPPAQAEISLDAVLSKICSDQCARNLRSIHQWLDAVSDCLIAECEKQLS